MEQIYGLVGHRLESGAEVGGFHWMEDFQVTLDIVLGLQVLDLIGCRRSANTENDIELVGHVLEARAV